MLSLLKQDELSDEERLCRQLAVLNECATSPKAAPLLASLRADFIKALLEFPATRKLLMKHTMDTKDINDAVIDKWDCEAPIADVILGSPELSSLIAEHVIHKAEPAFTSRLLSADKACFEKLQGLPFREVAGSCGLDGLGGLLMATDDRHDCLLRVVVSSLKPRNEEAAAEELLAQYTKAQAKVYGADRQEEEEGEDEELVGDAKPASETDSRGSSPILSRPPSEKKEPAKTESPMQLLPRDFESLPREKRISFLADAIEVHSNDITQMTKERDAIARERENLAKRIGRRMEANKKYSSMLAELKAEQAKEEEEAASKGATPPQPAKKSSKAGERAPGKDVKTGTVNYSKALLCPKPCGGSGADGDDDVVVVDFSKDRATSAKKAAPSAAKEANGAAGDGLSEKERELLNSLLKKQAMSNEGDAKPMMAPPDRKRPAAATKETGDAKKPKTDPKPAVYSWKPASPRAKSGAAGGGGFSKGLLDFSKPFVAEAGAKVTKAAPKPAAPSPGEVDEYDAETQAI